jgi:hypothetical protein
MKGSGSEESEYIRIGKTVVQKVQKLMLVSILSGSSNRGVSIFLITFTPTSCYGTIKNLNNLPNSSN